MNADFFDPHSAKIVALDPVADADLIAFVAKSTLERETSMGDYSIAGGSFQISDEDYADYHREGDWICDYMEDPNLPAGVWDKIFGFGSHCWIIGSAAHLLAHLLLTKKVQFPTTDERINRLVAQL